jgi:AraC-like DNA-binding protein
MEFWVAGFIRTCRQLCGRRLTAQRVSFIHKRKPTAELKSFFGCDVEFGAEADRAIFPLAIRDLAVVSADPYLGELLVKYCEEALSQRKPGGSSLGANVENAVALLLPHGKAQAGEVARHLGMSQRTLARRLSSEGSSFAGVLQGLRADLAKRHLADAELSISKIAWLLGYQNVSAFSNAFKRWNGKTPRDARRATQ